jgi:HEAT repeat protein
LFFVAAVVAAMLAGANPARLSAQAVAPTAASAPSPELSDLWDNFIHGIKVARAELVISNGKALLESGASDRDIYLLSVKEENLDMTLTRGSKNLKDAAPIIDQIRVKIESGYKAERSDPNQIANSIAMLPKNLRAYEIGAGRLVESGEYAVPQLVQKLMDSSTPPSLAERITNVLPRLGKAAIRPLTEALASNDARLQEIVADALGKIHYPESAAALKALTERKDVLPRTREIAMAALLACGGRDAVSKPVASLYYELAEKYYYQKESVMPDANAATANVWFWREGLGLESIAVPRAIFGDVYAMRFARLALKADGNFQPAVSLWLAARIKKDIDTPAGVSDPTQSPGQPPASFYALAGSARFMQDVLGRALKDGDSGVALRAIEALSKTAGAASLIEGPSASPLVAALTNAQREVRYLAAVALANALPQKKFKGDETVMVVFNEMLRQTGLRQALLVGGTGERRNVLKDALRSSGYDVIERDDADKAMMAIREVNGVDMVVLGDPTFAAGMVDRLRNDPFSAGVPIVIASTEERLVRLFKSDARVVLTGDQSGSADVAEAVGRAARAGAAGAMNNELAGQWAARAAGAIARLGETGNTVYDISKTRKALIAALGDSRVEVRMAAARALAMMSSSEAQQAMAALTLNPAVDEKIRIGVLGLLSDSLRRFGNQIDSQTAAAIVAAVANDKEPMSVREAMAEVLGAMNLPSEKIKSLILGAAVE